MGDITVLHTDDPQCLRYSLYPLRHSAHSGVFTFTTEASYCLLRDPNKLLLIVRYFKKRHHKRPSNMWLLQRLRERYDRIFLFDDGDGADSMHFEFMDYVDAYYKKQRLKDLSLYLRPTYRRQLFSDYYHQWYGVTDAREMIRPPLGDASALSKLRIAWNIGVAKYALPLDAPTHASEDSSRAKFIQARFDYRVYPRSIGYQRRLFLNIIKHRSEFHTEYLPADAYYQDLKRAAAVLSPFGYGEICHRDFEAILSGTVLVKPSMEHLVTWPDVYIPDETYAKIAWDGSDLVEVCQSLLADQRRCRRLAEQALQVYRDNFTRMDLKVGELIEHFQQR